MKRMLKNAGIIAVMCAVMLISGAGMVFADDYSVNIRQNMAEEAVQNSIQDAINGAGNGDTVTVTGSKTDMSSTLYLDIPKGVTVKWAATYSGQVDGSSALINAYGSGIFEVANNAAIVTNSDRSVAILREGGDIKVSGGTVTSNGNRGWAISVLDGNVTVSGGTVQATGANFTEDAAKVFALCAIEAEYGDVTVSGGTVLAPYGAAIYAWSGKDSPVTVTVSGTGRVSGFAAITCSGITNVSGGKVEVIGSGAHAIGFIGDAKVTGGTVSAPSGIEFILFDNAVVAYLAGTCTGNSATSPGMVVEVASLKAGAVGSADGLTVKGGGGSAKWGANGTIEFTLADSSVKTLEWGMPAVTPTPIPEPPTPVPPAKPVVQNNTIAAGSHHSLAIKKDGSLWAQGYNWRGQLGTDTPVGEDCYTPAKVMDDVVSVAAGGSHSLAIKADGSLWSWGDNQYGQIGDGTVTTYHYNRNNERVIKENNDKSKPVKIMDNVVSVAAGAYHSLALKADGSLWVWGDNEHGQLGDGTVATYYDDGIGRIEENNIKTKPAKIMNDVIFIEAGGSMSLAIKSDGSLWVWGTGTIGNGTWLIVEPNPVKVMDDVAFASMGGSHTLAVKTDGSLWAWGWNVSGQLGDGMSATIDQEGYIIEDNYKLWPTKIMDDVAFASAGTSHSMAIKTDGSLWAWGDNLFGQLGNGKITIHGSVDRHTIMIENNNESRPIKIMDNIAFAAAGHNYTLAIKADGILWSWGNYPGSLNSNNMSIPEKIMDGVKLPTDAVTPPPTPVPPTPTTTFPDVPKNHWAYDSIILLVNKGVISGYPDGTFRPNTLVTRSEFAKMMTLALEIPLLTNPTQSFKDVEPSNWDFLWVETAKKYLTGYQQGDAYYFKGGEAAVREDMAVALVKALELENQYVDVNELKTTFTDYNTISPELQKYVLVAYKNGLINGYPDGTFGAQKSITRAEAASLLVKVLKSTAMQKVTFN